MIGKILLLTNALLFGKPLASSVDAKSVPLAEHLYRTSSDF